MSEVKRYGRIGDMIEATEGLIKLYPMMSVYLLAADFDRVTAERDAALRREAALQKGFAQKVVLSVRDICELEPADSDDPECICINASDLGAILSRHFEGIE